MSVGYGQLVSKVSYSLDCGEYENVKVLRGEVAAAYQSGSISSLEYEHLMYLLSGIF